MKSLNTLILLLIAQMTFAQPKAPFDSTAVRQDVLMYIDSIVSEHNVIKTKLYKLDGYITTLQGLRGGYSEQFYFYQKMYSIATNSEWKILLNHPRAEIRYYAFESLIRLKEPAIPLLESEFNDTSVVMFWVGCQGKAEKLVNLYVYNFWYRLNAEEQFELLVKCSENSEKEIGKRLYKRIETRPSYYPLVKEKVMESNEPTMIGFLLRYKKKSDETVIIDAIEKAFLSKTKKYRVTGDLLGRLYVFSKSSTFKILLEKLIGAYINDELTIEEKAVNSLLASYAKYDKDNASVIFLEILRMKGQKSVIPIYQAINNCNYYNANYAELFFQLWEYEPLGNHLGRGNCNRVMSRLYQKDAQRTMKLVYRTVKNEINNYGTKEYFLALLICYQAKEYGHEFKYNQVKTYLNSENRRLQNIAIHIANYSQNQLDLLPLYLECLYKFTDNYQIKRLIRAIHKIDTSNKALLEWYEKNQRLLEDEYPTVISVLKEEKVL